ncbi:helix-turn-helix domain-containing protein [Nocardia puris]|uniref:helix-turn-helix domain-containing protein n=1 Tax=Nocardia puris TaxID=208602 RepID=UPI002E21AF9C
MTVTYAAGLIGVSPKTLRRWIDEEKVPAYRVGDFAIRVDQNEVLALVKPVRKTTGGAA